MHTQTNLPSPLRASFGCKCPKCGEGPLFKGAYTLEPAQSCTNCGLNYDFIDTGDGPAVLLSFLFGFAILGFALIVEYFFHPPLWFHAIVWTFLLFAIAIWFLRITKAWLIVMQFQNRAEQSARLEK